MSTTTPQDLTPGDYFPSPRPEEGNVRVVCAYGKCTHDPSRHDSVHVRGGNGNEWFIALIEREELHICEGQLCWMDNPTVEMRTLAGLPAQMGHVHANQHQR